MPRSDPKPSKVMKFTVGPGGLPPMHWETLLGVYPQLRLLQGEAGNPGRPTILCRDKTGVGFYRCLGELAGTWTIQSPQVLGPKQASLRHRGSPSGSEPDLIGQGIYFVDAAHKDRAMFHNDTLSNHAANPRVIPNPDAIAWVVVVSYRAIWPSKKAYKQNPIAEPSHITEVTMYRNTGQLTHWRNIAANKARKDMGLRLERNQP